MGESSAEVAVPVDESGAVVDHPHPASDHPALVRLVLDARHRLLEVMTALEGTSEDAAGLVRPGVERWLAEFERLGPAE